MNGSTYLSSFVHLRIRFAFVLETSIPAKSRRPSCVDDLTFCPALEQDRCLARTATVAEGADGVGGLVWICGEEVVQTGVAKSAEEVFAGRDEISGGFERAGGADHTCMGRAGR